MRKFCDRLINSIKKNYLSVIGSFLIIWFIVAFVVFPNLIITYRSFVTDDGFTVELFKKLIDSAMAVQGIKNSFLLAISLVITSNILGVFIVMVVEYFEIKGSKILRLGYMTTFIYSGIILVSGYIMVYGDNGLITKILLNLFPDMNPEWFTGFWAVLFILTVSTTTIHMMFLTNAIRSIDFFTIEASQNLGASTFYTIRRVVLPVILPTLIAITILQFLTGLGALSAPLMVGGKGFRTISPLILQLNKIPSSQGLAIVLSMILGITTLILIILFTRMEKGGTYFSISKTKAAFKKQKISNPIARVVVYILAYLIFFVYVTPVILIVIFSFTNNDAIYNVTLSFDSLTLQNYVKIFEDSDSLEPFVNSIKFSLQAAIMVVVIVLIGTYLRKHKKNIATGFIEYSFLIPWMLPGTLIAIGLITSFSTPSVFIFGQILIGTSLLLVLGYIIIRMPFTSRLLRAAFQALDDDYIKAAKSLGSGPFYAFRRITIPLIFPTIIALVALGFNDLLRDYNMAAFLAHPLDQTLGMLIYSYTLTESTGDSRAFIFVFSTILMIISGITIYIVYGIILNDQKPQFIQSIQKRLLVISGKVKDRFLNSKV